MFQLLSCIKQSQLLTATRYLNRRLHGLPRINQLNPAISYENKDKITINDVKNTHIVFVHGSYKPYCAIGHEYNIAGPKRGDTQLGETVIFSIPAFGDFFNDMIFHCKIKAPIVNVEKLHYEGNYPSVRWTDYPGERIMQKTRFKSPHINDEYTSEDIVFHRQFQVPHHKLIGWKRMVGQEIPMTGYFKDNENDYTPGYRIHNTCTNGLQTPKDCYNWNEISNRLDRPNDLEVFVPLLFWFNTDVRCCLPSIIIPNGSRFIEIDLADGEAMFGWQERGLHDVNITIENPIIEKLELFINNIFVNPRIYEIYIKTAGHTLVRLYTHQIETIGKSKWEWCNRNYYEIEFNNLRRQPIELIYMGIRPKNNNLSLSNWHRFSQCDQHTFGNFICNEYKPIFNDIRVNDDYHGVYPNMPQTFYNSYIPFRYGGHNINTPNDCGLVMINFCLYPGTFQPSGFSDIPMELKFDTTMTFSNYNRADLIISGKLLNFILIIDGGGCIKFP